MSANHFIYSFFKQNVLYALISILLLAGLWIAEPKVPSQPCGILLPLRESFKAEPRPQDPALPRGAVALINLQMHQSQTSPAAEKIVMKTAEALAREAEGQRIDVSVFGFEAASETNPEPLAKYVFQGFVIHDKQA